MDNLDYTQLDDAALQSPISTNSTTVTSSSSPQQTCLESNSSASSFTFSELHLPSLSSIDSVHPQSSRFFPCISQHSLSDSCGINLDDSHCRLAFKLLGGHISCIEPIDHTSILVSTTTNSYLLCNNLEKAQENCGFSDQGLHYTGILDQTQHSEHHNPSPEEMFEQQQQISTEDILGQQLNPCISDIVQKSCGVSSQQDSAEQSYEVSYHQHHPCILNEVPSQQHHPSRGDIVKPNSFSDKQALSQLHYHYTMEEARQSYGDLGSVRALTVIGNQIICAHQDHKIRIWKKQKLPNDPESHKPSKKHLIAVMPTVKDYLRTFLFGKNYVQIRRHHSKLWIEHVDAISALALTEDRQFIYSVSWDRSIKVWRMRDFKCMESINKAHDDAINAIAVSSDGFVYTGCANSKLKVWHHKTENQSSSKTKIQKRKVYKNLDMVATLEMAHAVNSVQLSDGGKFLYCGSSDGAIVVWRRSCEGQHMVKTETLMKHRRAVLCLRSATDEVLCSGSADHTIRVWRRLHLEDAVVRHTCVVVLHGHTSPVKCLSVWPHVPHKIIKNSKLEELVLCSGSMDGYVKLWSLPGINKSSDP